MWDERYQDIRFKDSKLVVDGSKLAYHLYNKYNLDQNHGGEYLALQALIQDFVNSLDNCGIEPYVVMDGGLGTSDIRLEPRMYRQEGLLRKVSAALKGERMDIYPQLTISLFKQTLIDMKVPLVNFFGEKNSDLAALASEWRCPVLSGDRVFYSYDLPGGLLPLDNFRWDGGDKVERSRAGIPCRLYTKPTARRDKTTKETFTAAMALKPNMRQQEQTEVQREVQKSMLEFQIPSSSLRGFFSEGPAPSLPAEMLRWVPEWFRASLTTGDLGADILVNRRKILRIQVEPSDLESSNLISQPIRRVLYGLLKGQDRGGVEEVDRVGLKIVRVMVQPVVQGAAQTLRMDSLTQADHAVRLQVCLETLGVEEETLQGVLAHLRLPVAVTCYWLRRAGPEPTLLKALLMVMVQGELNRQSGGTTGWQGDTKHVSKSLDGVVAHSLNQWQACMKDASQLNVLLCMPLPEPHFAWLYQGRLVHQRQKQLQEREPEEILQDARFRGLYRSLLEAVTQSVPGANRKSGGPEAQLTAGMENLNFNTQDDEEEELGGAKGLDQGLDSHRVSYKTRHITKARKDQSRNPERRSKQDRKEWD